uniref:Putative secreted peptide n=1 Tax=Anopheles braziliensis TaxID=58242 RepID=A0A2M3ZVV4_9DIPT
MDFMVVVIVRLGLVDGWLACWSRCVSLASAGEEQNGGRQSAERSPRSLTEWKIIIAGTISLWKREDDAYARPCTCVRLCVHRSREEERRRE